MVDIFTLLLGIVSLGVLTAAVSKALLQPRKVWDEDNYFPEEIGADENYAELRKENPHIWLEE